MRFKTNRIVFKWLMASNLCFWVTYIAEAQISDAHMDISYNLDCFTNLDDIEFETPNNGYALRGGMNWTLAGRDDLFLGFELGYSQRELERHLGSTKFELVFYATDFSILGGYFLTEELQAELGLGGSMFGVTLYENDAPVDLGDGFRNFDIYTTVGCSYKIYEFLSVGTRLRYGFIPALEYEPIDDYGDIGKERGVINQLTWGFFIRGKFYRLKGEK